MKGYWKIVLFLLFASPLWSITILGIDKLAQYYPHAMDAIPLISVQYDPISGRYLVRGSYELVYPTLLLLVFTLIFLWKTKVSLKEFGILALVIPLITLVFAFVISSLSNHSGYSDNSLVLIVGAYIMPVVSFLLGKTLYQALKRVRGL
ncbi:hypothetical protein FH039_09610 [Thermococcus indicus]|uniref:Uncharacterized protein n=1 Tax=Thermococcus indicus TaxID=2586643 RepID=A0A4Y5SNY2_9EURY|nr:hypothetical protein [Thermococcus indicus]QDA31802.1 hypothetical protein FH039_09610 [Thermococcus indicus]